ncbi:hypothetical protein TWF281_003809 [Arthrobotrys megalospora]
MSQVPRDIRNAMATTLCVVMRARGSCGTPNCMYSHEKRKFLCPTEQDAGSCKAAYCRYRHERDSDGHALGAGQSGYRTPPAAERQPTQRGEGTLAATHPAQQSEGGSALANPESKSVAAAPKAPPPPPPPAGITRWNAPDPITSNQAERDMVSLFRHPIRCPLELSELERRQMMDYASKLLTHHKPQFQRYAVREMSEPLAHTHFLDITNILMSDETGDRTFGIIIFLTRFIPLARLLGQGYWNTDAAVMAVFKKFVDDIFADPLYNIYILARGIASFVAYQGSEGDDIDWAGLFVDILHFFLNLAKFSKNHGETAGFPSTDYWMIRFVEQACDAWFEQPPVSENTFSNIPARPKKDVVFDELAELISVYNVTKWFAPSTYLPGQRRRLDDVRRLDCVEFREKGTCPGKEDESCFYAHRLSLVDKHVEKSDQKFESMELWSKFGSVRDSVTTEDLKAYWEQGLQFLEEGNVDFIFESLMRKEGTFLIEQTLKVQNEDGEFNFDTIKPLALIVSDERLEEYNQKESKVATIADVFVDNKSFFTAWTKDIGAGLAKTAKSEPHIEAANLLAGLARFMLSLSPINKLDDETKAALVSLCRLVAEHSEEGAHTMGEANAVAERLGFIIRRNLMEETIEIIDRDAPDMNAINFDESVSLIFSDDEKKAENVPLEINKSIDEQLIDMEPIQQSRPVAKAVMELIGLEPLPSVPIQKQQAQPEAVQKGTVECELVAEVLATEEGIAEGELVKEEEAVEVVPAKAPSQAAPAEVAISPAVTMMVMPPVGSDAAKPEAEMDRSSNEENELEDESESRGPSLKSTCDIPSIQLLEDALKSLENFFEFDLVRPAARLTDMDNKGHFIVLKVFFTTEHLYIDPEQATGDITIFTHFIQFLETVTHKLSKHDLDAEPGWRNIMGALFRKLWSPGEFVDFFRNGLRDFYILHEDRARFNSAHRKLYRRATENMLRLLLGLIKTGQLPRADGAFQTLILRFLRIFTEEYRPIPSTTVPGVGSSEQARRDRDPKSYHRWTKTHSLINVLVLRTGLGGFFKQVPGEVGRDPQPRPLFKHPHAFICPDKKISRCEFAVHCQFAHEAEDAGTLEEASGLESDTDDESESDDGTERGNERFFPASSRIGQGGSVVSASEDESALSVNSMSTVIDARGVGYI